MNALHEALEILKRLATEQGNDCAQAVLDELARLNHEIENLHLLNSELNGILRDLRQAFATRGELQVPEYRAALSFEVLHEH